MKRTAHRGDSSVSGKKAVRENTEIKKNRKPNGRRAAMDMEKVQAVFLCHKIKNQTEK